MIIGVPKEIKTREYRVGMTPAGVRQLTKRGHTVRVERGAGEGSGILHEQYALSGLTIVGWAKEVLASQIVVKVQAPTPSESGFLPDGLMLDPCLNLAADPELTKQLAEKGVASVAYETI